MDSVTHVALGAALGEAILGKKLGTRAMFWGAIAGSLPDIDVLFGPFEDDIGFLTHHRGITHSILFVLVLSPILGWLLARWLRRRSPEITPLGCTGLFFAGLMSHILLDACTTYGTQLFLPLSDYQVALNNIFIADPLFTLPLLISGIACLVLRQASGKRRAINYGGIALSCLYLAVTFVNQFEARQVFAASLREQHIDTQRLMIGPTPFNSILWCCIAEQRDGFRIGYYSLLDTQKQVRFSHVPRNAALIENFKGRKAVEQLVWFSNGYYTVHQQQGRLVFDILKLGILSLDADDSQVVFSFVIQPEEHGGLHVWNASQRRGVNVSRLMAALWGRIRGGEPRTF
jgi:inner membrane protein